MLVGRKYKIESDSLNVTLFKKRTTKKGGEAWSPIAYHSNVKEALVTLVNLEVSETGLKDLRSVVAKQDELIHLIGGLKNER